MAWIFLKANSLSASSECLQKTPRSMAIKKSELYATLWKSCDELRGGMDASQYKDYVLTFLFIKYVSDKYGDRDDAVVSVPAGGSFSDMIKLKGKPDIGDQINKIIARLAEENDLKGVIDLTDFNDEEKLGRGKEMVDRLSALIGIFENPSLNFSRNRADGDDILGDAYEYLMRHFATESGKSKGQFYTPAEVSRVLAKVVGAEHAKSQDQTVYDPTCGSGSLLLKVADEAPTGLSIYGQENDNATKALAVMNMWMHGYESAEIWKGNTLSSPNWKDNDGSLKKFDFIVANPPFSYASWRSGFEPENDLYNRFDGFGIPPEKNGDFAFLLHVLKSMKSTGKAAVILPHGVLFRGGAEGEIRKNLIQRGYIKGIIGLPSNLFYGTGIPACVIVLDKEEAHQRKGIFMVDGSKGFIKDGNKNRLREQDLHRIVDVFNNQLEVPKYARLVPVNEIEKNEFNLNIPRYIDSQEEEDIQDLMAHMAGGIPNRDVDGLDRFWKVYPNLRVQLFQPASRAGYSDLKVPKDEVKALIFSHPEFTAYSKELDLVLDKWKNENYPLLTGIGNQTKPLRFIHQLAESLLANYSGKALIDRYDIYQHLMNYWNETMKDDLYMLVEDGWVAKLEPVKDAKGKVKNGEFDSELVPKVLVINRYFPDAKASLEQKELELETITRELEELIEEHGGEEGLLSEVLNDKGKVSKGDVSARMKQINGKRDYADELAVLEKYMTLTDQEASAKKAIKDAQVALDQRVASQYPTLTELEIKTLVVDDKWLTAIQSAIKNEIDGISQRLTHRVKELADRYGTTLPVLETEVTELTKKVSAHLEKMGVVWT
jgi:type I restriction enzyme M protein